MPVDQLISSRLPHERQLIEAARLRAADLLPVQPAPGSSFEENPMPADLNVCPDLRTLEEFHLGRLPGAEMVLVRQHLEQCEACRIFAGEAKSASAEAETLMTNLSTSHDAPAGPKPDPLAIPRQIGQYEILRVIGRGGMGAVYQARHTKLDKIVALKVLPRERLEDQAAVERFQREMRAVGKLQHPHIVAAHDAGEHLGMHFLVMEYVDGVDLAALTRRMGPLPVAESCELIRQAAIGLQHASGRGLVHRDIKPSNLILARTDDSPSLKILDFGLALLEEPNPDGLTATGQFMGTLEYMAPEQALNTHTVDVRADIYSLGASLFKLLTNTTPFPTEQFRSPLQMMMSKTQQNPPSIAGRRPDLPADLLRLIDRLLLKDPAERPATAAELAQALAPFARGANLDQLLQRYETSDSNPEAQAVAAIQPTVSASPAVSQVASRRSPFRWLLAAGALAVLLLVGVVIYVKTGEGMLEIQSEDPNAKVIVEKDGKEITIDLGAGQTVKVLNAGKWQVKLKGVSDDFELDQDHFTLTRGETEVVRITRVSQVANGKPVPPEETPAAGAGVSAAWIKATAVLPAEEQAKAVEQELLKLNPEFKGLLVNEIKEEQVVGWSIPSGTLPDLSPLLALTSLKQLTYMGLDPERDAPVLREITSLETINKRSAEAFRLCYPVNKPKAGVDKEWLESVRQLDAETQYKAVIQKLREQNPGWDGTNSTEGDFSNPYRLILNVRGMTDLAPVHGLTKVRGLHVRDEKPDGWLTDLSSLGGMPLEYFGADGLPEIDLSQLSGLPLREMVIGVPTVSDLTPLKQLKLEVLFLGRTQITDVSALRVLPLKKLGLNFNSKLTDLAPLQGLPLTDLSIFHQEKITDLTPLQGMPLTSLNCGSTEVSDLSVLKGMPLTFLNCSSTLVTDLSPLKGLPLRYLYCDVTGVSDLTPLAGGSLEVLYCQNTKITDLSPLKGMPLKQLMFDQMAPENLAIVREIKTLETINNKPAAEFWKEIDAQPTKPAMGTAVDRKAAEWVLSVGGTIIIDDGMERMLNKGDALPAGAFRLRSITLVGNESFKSKDLAALAGLASLRYLDLSFMALSEETCQQLAALKSLEAISLRDTGLTDAGVKHLAGLPNLNSIYFAELNVTDAGIKELARLPKLHSLSLWAARSDGTGFRELTSLSTLHLRDVQVNREGLKAIASLPKLDHLHMAGSSLTGGDLQELRPLKKLIQLNVDYAKITDDSLVHLPEFTRLKYVSLMGAQITDAGVARLKACSDLHALNLESTPTTDQSLEAFSTLSQLREIKLKSTKVTEDGVKKLAAALPGCRVFWEGGTIEPTPPANP